MAAKRHVLSDIEPMKLLAQVVTRCRGAEELRTRSPDSRQIVADPAYICRRRKGRPATECGGEALQTAWEAGSELSQAGAAEWPLWVVEKPWRLY